MHQSDVKPDSRAGWSCRLVRYMHRTSDFMSPHPPTDEELDLRASPRFLAPDWAERLRSAPAPAWLLLLIFVVVVIAHGPTTTGGLVGVVLVVLVLSAPWVFTYINTRIFITRDLVICWDALRRAKRSSRHDLDHIVILRLQILGPRFVLTRVLLEGADGAARLSLQRDAWSDNQLNSIYTALGLPVRELSEPMTPRQAERAHPGATSVALRWWPLIALGMFAVAFLIFGFVLQAAGYRGH